MVIVLMGAAGAGKTTVGRRLAEQLAWPFLDGDALHPPENIAKMRRGTPLTDDDRRPCRHLEFGQGSAKWNSAGRGFAMHLTKLASNW